MSGHDVKTERRRPVADPVMSIRAVGPAADGRLALSEIARLCGEVQATLERLALSVTGGGSTPGRRPRDIVDAVRLELVAFRPGSAVLDMAPPDEAMLTHELLDVSTELLFSGLGDIANGAQKVPKEFTPQVLDGLIRLSGGLSKQTVHYLEFSLPSGENVVVDQEFRDQARRLRRQRRHDMVTIVGRLHEGDFDPLALRCRVDTVDATVSCSFAQDMRGTVLDAMDSMVIASGVAEMQPDGRVRALDLDDLTVIDEAQRRSIDQLAEEQGVQPVNDIDEFATMTDLGDDEFGSFFDKAMSARS